MQMGTSTISARMQDINAGRTISVAGCQSLSKDDMWPGKAYPIYPIEKLWAFAG